MLSKILSLPQVRKVNIERCINNGFDITVNCYGGSCVSVHNSNPSNGLDKAYELILKNHIH
jgi:hypothetical protein